MSALGQKQACAPQKAHVRFTPNGDRTSGHPPTGDHQKPVGPIIKPLSIMLEWPAISHKFVPMQESRVHLCIKDRQTFADGATFGAAGAYEIFYGRARAEIAPDSVPAGSVVDIDLAPREANGLIACAADIAILKAAAYGRWKSAAAFRLSKSRKQTRPSILQ